VPARLDGLWGGVCIVVQPLKALLRDQKRIAERAGVGDCILFHGDNECDWKKQLPLLTCVPCVVRLVFISPELLLSVKRGPTFVDCFKKLDITAIFVDEAHVISTWGDSMFRPILLNLGSLRDKFTNIPMVAMTARTQKRIEKVLRFGADCRRVSSSLYRSNLFVEVIDKEKHFEEQVHALMSERIKQGEAAILYVATRKSAEKLAAYLRRRGWRALSYHAGRTSTFRCAVEKAFLNGGFPTCSVIVATISFGV
jgi:ATP-dependent DNA helicase RecQ